MHTEYRHLLESANDDEAVRVVVVTGAGRAFSVGADTEALQGHTSCVPCVYARNGRCV